MRINTAAHRRNRDCIHGLDRKKAAREREMEKTDRRRMEPACEEYEDRYDDSDCESTMDLASREMQSRAEEEEENELRLDSPEAEEGIRTGG